MGNLALVVNREGEIWSQKGLVAHVDSKKELEYLNGLGVDQTVTTLTTILPQIIEQKFYEVPLADYADIAVGQGNPFDSELYNWTSGVEGSDFEAGLMNMGSASSTGYADDIVLEPFKRKVVTWRKNVGYNIIEDKTFSRGTQNMSLIQAKYQARKKQYDLGLQNTFFLGLKSDKEVKGLLNQDGVTTDTSTLTKPLSAMTATEFTDFVANLLKQYQAMNGYTAMPNRFVVPQDDYIGLTRLLSETYPVPGSTRIEVLENAIKPFAPDFKVLGSAYSMKTKLAEVGLNVDRYALYRKATDSLVMNIPLDFTITLPNTPDNFNYISTAYSRFTGLNLFRPLEMMYFDIQ